MRIFIGILITLNYLISNRGYSAPAPNPKGDTCESSADFDVHTAKAESIECTGVKAKVTDEINKCIDEARRKCIELAKGKFQTEEMTFVDPKSHGYGGGYDSAKGCSISGINPETLTSTTTAKAIQKSHCILSPH
jgi:hypothetical protein